MKKSIYLLVLVLGFATNVYSKGHHVLISVNHTTGDSISQSFNSSPCNLYVMATAGDSLTLYIYYESLGTFTLETPQQWYLEGDSIQGAFQIDPLNIIAPAMGNITADFVGGMYMQFTIVASTGIFEHHESVNSLKIFPNITGNTSINIQLNLVKPGDVNVILYDINGKCLRETFQKDVSGQFTANENIEELNSGVYFIRVKTQGELFSGRFIKL